MTLRDDVRGLLAEPGGSGVADLGIAGLPAELVGTVLTHFADTASIGDADALSPIVMRSSHVPFDAELDGVSQEAVDPLGELSAVVEPGNDANALDGDDPSMLDGFQDDAVTDAATTDAAGGEAVVGDDDDFGAGAEHGPPDLEVDDPLAFDSVEEPVDAFGYTAAADDVDPMRFDDDSPDALEAPIDIDVDGQEADSGLDDLLD